MPHPLEYEAIRVREAAWRSEEDDMSDECCGPETKDRKAVKCGGVAGGLYGLGFIGAAVYFIGHAATFWAGVLGFLKALVWPAFLVHKLMTFLNM